MISIWIVTFQRKVEFFPVNRLRKLVFVAMKSCGKVYVILLQDREIISQEIVNINYSVSYLMLLGAGKQRVLSNVSVVVISMLSPNLWWNPVLIFL